MNIIHDREKQQFSCLINDHEAQLNYKKLEVDKIDIYRTYVPDTLRGQGIAGELVTAALDWAKGEQIQVVASCWYAAKKIKS